MKRCLTIQDYSCMGRCSLTVALPILSSLGVETVGLPTAILSNHTAFDDWSYFDLSSHLLKFVDKWEKYNDHFDCIYTGYLGNGQGKIVEKIIQKLKREDTIVVIDPAFGDNGKLYPGFSKLHVDEMVSLLKYADIICPNVTETNFLLGTDYKSDFLDEIKMQRLTTSLSKFGPSKIVVTGLLTDNNEAGYGIFDRNEHNMRFYFSKKLKGSYHGAGDTFASTFVGSYLNGLPIFESVKIAHNFVHKCMKEDIAHNIDGVLYGLEFESQLPYLLKMVEKEKMNIKKD